MRPFLIKIMLFFAVVAVVDFSLGRLFYYLQSNKAGGRTGAEFYICEKATEDIIVMGSSRASHHYVSDIISRELGMSCFNAGQDGNGIILQYGRWKLLSKRYAPKLLIYDINPSFDLEINDNMTYVDRLKPFCRDSAVAKYVSSIFPLERLKLLSNMYRFNYKFLELIADSLRKGDYLTTGGYIPLAGSIRQEVVDREPTEKVTSMESDSVKLFYLEQFMKEVTECGTEMIFVVSPSWRGGNYSVEAYENVIELAQQYGAKFYDYIDSTISDNADCFEDSSHLNDDGARLFTEDLVKKLI